MMIVRVIHYKLTEIGFHMFTSLVKSSLAKIPSIRSLSYAVPTEKTGRVQSQHNQVILVICFNSLENLTLYEQHKLHRRWVETLLCGWKLADSKPGTDPKKELCDTVQAGQDISGKLVRDPNIPEQAVRYEGETVQQFILDEVDLSEWTE